VKVGPAQLALRFPVRKQCTFEAFEAAGNVELVGRLRPENAPAGFSAVWIVGECGSGKSHLLQAACAARSRLGGYAAYLPANVREGGAEALDGLERFRLVAIDDLESWLADDALESALLALYQRLVAGRATLVVASTSAPASLAFALADLGSRLRAAEVLGIAPLDDAARTRLVTRIAHEKGLDLEPEVAAYLLKRGPRGSGALCALMDRLDAESLASQRRLTIPLVRAVLDAAARAP
jgi:DnaA family protein